MNLQIFLIVSLLSSFCLSTTLSRPLDDELIMQNRHDEWMAKHGRIYADVKEKNYRYVVFKRNVERIERLNSVPTGRTFKLAVNQFADLTNEEFRSMYTGYKGDSLLSSQSEKKTTSFRYQNVSSGALPKSVDWRKKGAVTPIKSQHFCGKDGTCNIKKAEQAVTSIKGYEDVPVNNEKALMKAVAHQPVSIAIEGGGFDFRFYSSGVFTGKCTTDLDHGVTVVGYGQSNNGSQYWIIKNSWGLNWGEYGYMRIKKDVKDKKGLCGLAMKSSYPIV
ncbi:unnamed protein product [Thlaspi arvense]|uniref:Uncharacterized protein n=1 Tax=Thlaspi arvense TaxID=13288 RepID=A0AAU9RN29_THLAR|nr:unnamed protein product [Thlaspi arvense]